MGLPDVTFVHDPPDWPVLLPAAAGILLSWELLMLVRAAFAGRRPASGAICIAVTLFPAVAITIAGAWSGKNAALLALLTAPLLIAVVASYAMLAANELGRALTKATLRAGLLTVLATLAFYYPIDGSVLAILACGVIWVFRSYAQTTSPISKAAKGFLVLGRIVVLLLLGVWIMHPGMDHTRKTPIPSVTLIGVDVSSSMQRKDMPQSYQMPAVPADSQPVRRIDAVQQALADQMAGISQLTQQGDVDIFTFSTKISPNAVLPARADSDEPIPKKAFEIPDATATATAIGDSTAEAFNPYISAGKEVGAIILFTDGCNNTADTVEPLKESELMGSRKIPIYTVAVGSDTVIGSTRSIVVKELRAADEIEAFNRLPIAATVEANGLAGKPLKVTCKFGDEVVGAETYTPASKQDTYKPQFTYVPLKTGFHRLKITVEPENAVADLSGQPSADKLVHVFDRELRILYIEGKFRYETKYVAQALAGERRFTIDRRYILQPVTQKEGLGLGENIDDWLRYHAIILGDVPASAFTPKQHEILKQLVSEKGKGLCMLGGFNAFGAGGWDKTPLADVMPVDLAASDKQIKDLVQVVPTEEGLRSELMRIDPDNNDIAAVWKLFQPVDGANKLVKPKPGAAVLAATPAGDPMIVCQTYGTGRSLAIAFDLTWQWVLTKRDTAKDQQRFWRQVALYLAAPKGDVWIAADRTSYDLRRLESRLEFIDVTAGATDAFGSPAPDSAIKEVLLIPPNNLPAQKLTLDRKGDTLRTRLSPPSQSGIYTLKINAEIAGKPLTAEYSFEVVYRDLEALDVLANYTLLRQMAQKSGGKFYRLHELPQLLKDIRKSLPPKFEEQIIHEDLADAARWPLLIAVLTLLCLEWAVRKRKGLV